MYYTDEHGDYKIDINGNRPVYNGRVFYFDNYGNNYFVDYSGNRYFSDNTGDFYVDHMGNKFYYSTLTESDRRKTENVPGKGMVTYVPDENDDNRYYVK